MTKRRRPRGRSNIGKVPSLHLPVTFEAGKGFVTAVIHIDNSTIGLRFEQPEQMLEFFYGLMEHAAIAWPNDPYIRLYQEGE
jgi:hypothetical protein